MRCASRRRLAGIVLVVGGVLWMVLRPLISNAWGQSQLGLTYEDYNRLMVAPLILLLAGTWGLSAHDASGMGRLGRWGLGLLALGLVVSLAGVVIEFWWGGGLRGNRDLAMAGWSIYGLGLLGQTVGLALFGVGALRAGVLPTWLGMVPLVMAALHVLWLPSLALGLGTVSVLDQILLGVGWIALGFAIWSRPSERPAGTARDRVSEREPRAG